MHTYSPTGVCSREITFDIIQNKVVKVNFIGGCDGNLKGLSSLIEGMDVDDAIKRLQGITCGSKNTSCPDQLSKALQEAKKNKIRKVYHTFLILLIFSYLLPYIVTHKLKSYLPLHNKIFLYYSILYSPLNIHNSYYILMQCALIPLNFPLYHYGVLLLILYLLVVLMFLSCLLLVYLLICLILK